MKYIMIIYLIAFLSYFLCFGFYNQPHIGKMLIFSAAMLMHKPIHEFKMQRLHWMLLALFVWMFICCGFSSYPTIAYFGFHLRMEGFISYLIMLCFGFHFWMQHKDWKPMLFYITSLILIISTLYFIADFNQFTRISMTPVALGGFLSVVSIILWATNPFLIIPIIPFIILSNTRSAIIAIIASIGCYEIFKKAKDYIYDYYLIISMIFISILVFTPLWVKINSLDFNKLGQGARSQWILQASDLAYSLPLTGFGLDTLSKYLKPATANYAQVNAICDKTHCIIYDLILQLGWFGYTMALLLLGMALWITLNNRTKQNVVCFSVIVGWITFNMFNPSSIYATVFVIWAILGLREAEIIKPITM